MKPEPATDREHFVFGEPVQRNPLTPSDMLCGLRGVGTRLRATTSALSTWTATNIVLGGSRIVFVPGRGRDGFPMAG